MEEPNMLQPKDEPITIEFDALIEDPLKLPKSEQIKEEEDPNYKLVCVESSRLLETQDPQNGKSVSHHVQDESTIDHKDVLRNSIVSQLMMQVKDEPPSSEFEATMEDQEIKVKIEQPIETIDDLSSNFPDTVSTESLDVPSLESIQAHDDTGAGSSTIILRKSFDAISDGEAQRMVAKYFANPSKKVKWRGLEKFRIGTSDGFGYNSSSQITKKRKTGYTNPDVDASEDDFLYWCLTHEVHKTYDLQTFFWFNFEAYQDFSDSHEDVFSWCNQTFEDLASGTKVVSIMNLGETSVNIKAISNSNAKTLVDLALFKSDPVNIDSHTYKTSKDQCNSTRSINDNDCCPTNNAHRYSNSFFSLLWGKKKIWVLLRPENEWKLHSKLYEMLGRSRTVAWEPIRILPSHPRELLVKPVQLESWDIPYELVVQYPGDLLHLSDRVVLYALDAGPNIGVSIKIRCDSEGSNASPLLVNQYTRQKVIPKDLDMARVVEIVCTENQSHE